MAGDPGGREDRPLRLRGPGAVLVRPVRPQPADRQRGAVLGRRRHRHVDHGHLARGRRDLRPGHARADGRVDPASASAPPTTRRSPPSAPPSPTPAPTSRRSAPTPSTTRPTTSGCINGQKAWATNGGIADVHVVIASVDRELGSRGHAAFIVPPGTKGCEQGAKVKKHGLRASHTADVHLDDCRVPGACLLGGKEKLDERLARVREGKKRQVTGRDADLRGEPADGRLAGARHRPRRLRVRARLRQGAAPVRQGDHREPGDRVHARRT